MPVISIFDEIDRTSDDPANYQISQFDYLNSSGRTEAARVRLQTENMYSRYPAPHQNALRSRLRSLDDTTHFSAAFELITHEVLIRSGCAICAIEPKVRDATTVPDFLVQTADGKRFYVENVLATGRSSASAGAEKRLRQVLHAIDTTPSPDFFLKLKVKGTPAAPVRTSQLKQNLSRWIGGLRYDELVAQFQLAKSTVEPFRYSAFGMALEIEPIPRGGSRGSAKARTIGIQMGELEFVDDVSPLRKAVLAKATRYGHLDFPYVVAVNTFSDTADDIDVVDAMFGTEVFVVHADGDKLEAEPTRNSDGIWHHGGAPANTRVSAVLIFDRLTFWSLADRRIKMLQNPWSRRPLPIIGVPVDDFREDRGKLTKASGKTVGEILGLPKGWPGEAASV